MQVQEGPSEHGIARLQAIELPQPERLEGTRRGLLELRHEETDLASAQGLRRTLVSEAVHLKDRSHQDLWPRKCQKKCLTASQTRPRADFPPSHTFGCVGERLVAPTLLCL
jgi:hypothetical protein